MDNAYDTMRRAVREARTTLAAADSVANGLAEILTGRLRHVSAYHLKALKRELRDFNITTGKWS